MRTIRRFWDWLGKEGNVGRLQFLGAILVACLGWMTVFYQDISGTIDRYLNPPVQPPKLPSAQTAHSSYISATQELEKRLLDKPNKKPAKNIILITAEGMGVSVNTLFRIGIGQIETGGNGEDYSLPHDRFQHSALIKTYQADAQTTGSGFNDIFTGVKSNQGNIGTQSSPDSCKDLKNSSFLSIAEIMSQMDKATGIVANVRVTYSSVAANYAKVSNRIYESQRTLPPGCKQKSIVDQLLDSLDDGTIDIVLGGGTRKFKERGVFNQSFDWMEVFTSKENIELVSPVDVSNPETISWKNDKSYVGLFSENHMSFEASRNEEPSLAQMTKVALDRLSKNEDGFFLNITSGRIDHALHGGEINLAIEEAKALISTINVVLANTNPNETLVILATGHDMPVSMNGYCARGKPITGLCYNHQAGMRNTLSLDQDGNPYPIVTLANGPKTFSDYPDLTTVDYQSIDYVAPAGFRQRASTHSPADVAVYANGPWSHLISGTMEQNMLFHFMLYAASHKEE